MKKQFPGFYKKSDLEIKKMWNDNFVSTTGMTEETFLREFIGDYLGIFCIEKELDRILNLDDKYTFISYSYNWVCYRYPRSFIDSDHPHHSLRLNVLLLSNKIQKFFLKIIMCIIIYFFLLFIARVSYLCILSIIIFNVL